MKYVAINAATIQFEEAKEFAHKDWSEVFEPFQTPGQANFEDCGVYVLYFLDALTRTPNKALDLSMVSHLDIPAIRTYLIASIVQNQICIP